MSDKKIKPLRGILVENPDLSHEDGYLILKEYGFDFDPIEKEILEYIDTFVKENEGLPSIHYTVDHFKSIGRTSVFEYLELLLKMPEVPSMDLKAFLKEQDNLHKNRGYSELIKTVASIHMGETKIGKEVKKGRLASIEHFIDQVEKFGNVGNKKSSQVGDMRTDARQTWEDYKVRKANPILAFGVTSGFTAIDDCLKGGKPGELHFVLAYTGSGKTMFTLNYLYNVVYYLNRDAVLFSLEMDKEQIQMLLYCIHSANPKFSRFHAPIDSRRFLYGELTESEERFMEDVVIKDLETNTQYGTLVIEYPGESFTCNTLKTKLSRLQRKYDIEMVAVDYPELMTPDKGQRFSDYGTSLNSIIKNIKQLALTYNNGKGVFILCPYQANRDGQERASKNGGLYDLRAMSYANEAERACDVVYSLYKDEAVASKEVLVSCLKNRRGPKFDPIKLSVLWESSYMSDMNTPQEFVEAEYDFDDF
jgi:replicative DNA helicase